MRDIRFKFSSKSYYAKQLINSILIGLIQTGGENSFNPLSVILKENKLTGPNYIDWKRNLNLVLTAQEYKFVLIDLCPLPLDSDS